MARISEQVEWLNLIDRSGPFLVPVVLEEVFPQGLEKIETPRRQRLRAAYDEWRDAVDEDDPELADLHDVWTRMVIRETLEYEDAVLVPRERLDGRIVYRAPGHGVETAPDFAVRADTGDTRLLIAIHPPKTDLEKPLRGERWSASPVERMTLLCRVSEVRIGLVTNGEEWMLVNAPIGSTSGYASWFARLWWLEPVTLKAFVSLLGVRRCFGPSDETLDQLLERSIAFQEKVTDTLGEQVRRAVEVLIQALGRADQDRNGELLKDVRPAELYEAGLTVMMRLVFILCAEERGLLLLGDPVYDQHYAISTLRAGLREDESQHGPEVLERRHDAWSRMLAVFRAVYGGVEHEMLRMPALGGSLFDLDRFPFLEGRAKETSWREEPAFPLPIDNHTVLLLLTALQVLEQRGGAHLLSYRALDVEQIGHVYEGLLEYTVAKLPEVTVGLIGSQKVPHPTIGLAELESLHALGVKAAAKHLADITGRSATAIENSLRRGGDDAALIELIRDCGGDETLARRLLPFAELIRTDSWGARLVYQAGSFAVTHGADRRETGTHYTPRSLTESIVEKALEPIVYIGPADGKPREGWKLRPPAELLDLKVCDPAMGSGAFLVQVCRYLAERLVEAWAREEDADRVITIDGIVRDSVEDEEPLPKSLDDRLLIAKRLVAERCLYGVDLNPLAVELAKLSIWLVTLAKGRPFGFLDHNLRCGDSLLGIHRLEQLTKLKMNPDDGPYQQRLFGQSIEAAVRRAIELRKRLREVPIRDIRDVEAMAYLNEESRKVLEGPSLVADAFIGEALQSNGNGKVLEAVADFLAIKADRLFNGNGDARRELQREAHKTLSVDLPAGRQNRRPFHWALEFPEVFSRGDSGFAAFVSNPPFLGGKRICHVLGDVYNKALKLVFDRSKGSADLCAYFFRRAWNLLRSDGTFGLLATNTISQADTREVGLDVLADRGGTIYNATTLVVWPGSANVHVSVVHIAKSHWEGTRILDSLYVKTISPQLTESFGVVVKPKRLKSIFQRASGGTGLLGIGFVIDKDTYRSWITTDSRYRDVLRPYINGKELNSTTDFTPPRYVIDFEDKTEEEAQQYPLAIARVRELVKPKRDVLTRQIHEKCYWKHWDKRTRLYKALRPLDRVLVCSFVSKHLPFAFLPTGWVYSKELVVIPTDDAAHFAILQSIFHAVWVRHFSGTLKSDLSYSISDGLRTFVSPTAELDDCRRCGEEYYRLRMNIQKERGEGLTSVYNRLHDESEDAADIRQLRDLHAQMDVSAAEAYGWNDLDLEHSFHEVVSLPENDRVRWTISEKARLEVLRRLARLNKERFEEEVRQGLHGKKSVTKPKPRRDSRKSAALQKVMPLFQGQAYPAPGQTATDLPMAAEARASYRSRNRSNHSGENHAHAILTFLEANTGCHAKSDILAATGVPENRLKAAIDALMAEGKVVRHGERRGATYRASMFETGGDE